LRSGRLGLFSFNLEKKDDFWEKSFEVTPKTTCGVIVSVVESGIPDSALQLKRWDNFFSNSTSSFSLEKEAEQKEEK
jgi:hypothetical protein